VNVCTPICGDNLVVPPEQCDDGNVIDNDYCTNQCLSNNPNTSPSSSSNTDIVTKVVTNVGMIVGIVVGVVAAIIITVIIVVLVCKNKRETANSLHDTSLYNASSGIKI
jgi:cysteine-rich repeat protein